MQALSDKRLENTAWGLLFVLWGVSIFFDAIPFGVGVAGTGLILLGLNAVRAANKIPTRPWTTLCGVVALVWGGLELLRPIARLPFQLNDWAIFSIVLVVIGLVFLRYGLFQARNGGSAETR